MLTQILSGGLVCPESEFPQTLYRQLPLLGPILVFASTDTCSYVIIFSHECKDEKHRREDNVAGHRYCNRI
ncbi:unnamed protein product [Allacma fusca]|uniref:Uncharacterized protein n=1 Tax=Allacma fusca TaxID=39272 RepID=A0A8J2LAL8_9HEXA|nr:unnamed protein product [Allacma fusca]